MLGFFRWDLAGGERVVSQLCSGVRYALEVLGRRRSFSRIIGVSISLVD